VSDQEFRTRIERLAAAVRRGEDREAACAELYRLLAPRLVAFFSKAGAGEDAPDLTQETLYRVFMYIDEFRGDASFSTWMFQIARYRWASYWRDRRAAKRRGVETSLGEPAAGGDAESPDAEQEPVSEAPGPERGAEGRERWRRVARGAAQLPPQMRRCFQLRMGQDLDVREIAGLLDLSAQTVKSHLYQARRRLAPLLDDPVDSASDPPTEA
jgi:RNA polymerase sigma-70 factor (ECF subfamily)